MPTTVHVPPRLLATVDRKARALGVSRNRLVVRALEQFVSAPAAWPQEFVDALLSVEPEVSEAVDELSAIVAQNRRSKPAPQL